MNEENSAMRQPASGMISRRCRVRFLTPAFLGDADQNGRWRTPPFKHLLREWWRIAYFASHADNFSLEAMRREEGLLFGHAWLDDDTVQVHGRARKVQARRSRVRIRLETETEERAWNKGRQSGVKPLSTGGDTSYAWFGLVDARSKQDLRTGIRPGEAEGRRVLKLAWPEREDNRMHAVLRLIRDFGQIGSRSRGGWGAVHLDDIEPLESTQWQRFARPLEDCLATGWPASFAVDAGGLMFWNSRQTFEHWPELMDFVARRRKEIRKPLKMSPDMNLRAVLGSAKDGDRLANPLRWRPVLEADGTLRVQIFAMPWRVIDQVKSIRLSESNLAVAWQNVARTLDQHGDLERSAA